MNNNALKYCFVFAVMMVAYYIFGHISSMIPLGFGLTALLLVDFLTKMQQQVAILYVMLFNYILQHFLASLVLYYNPPINPVYEIPANQYDAYLQYAVGALLAMYAGVGIVERKLRNNPYTVTASRLNVPAWSRYGIQFIAIGFISSFLGVFIPETRLGFLLGLMAMLLNVGVYAAILQDDNRCNSYALLLIGVEFAKALHSGMFHDLVLVTEFVVLLYIYKYRSRKVVLVLIPFVLLFVNVLQEIKADYRKLVWGRELVVEQKFDTLLTLVHQRVVTGNLIQTYVGETFVRYNQGWILNKVLLQVPDRVPFANGEIIYESLYNAIVPRILDKDKAIAGGVKNFERFTGLKLTKTSMNVGVLGDMYVNFGFWGGIVGVGVFGYCVARLYGLLHARSLSNPVWYAWAGYVGYWLVKGEEGFQEATSWAVKSLFVMSLCIFVTKKLRRTAQ